MAEAGEGRPAAPSPLHTPLLFVTVMIVATSGLVYELLRSGVPYPVFAEMMKSVEASGTVPG